MRKELLSAGGLTRGIDGILDVRKKAKNLREDARPEQVPVRHIGKDFNHCTDCKSDHLKRSCFPVNKSVRIKGTGRSLSSYGRVGRSARKGLLRRKTLNRLIVKKLQNCSADAPLRTWKYR